MLIHHKSAAVIATATTLAALTGCGSSSGSANTVTPAAYVKSVCQAVGPFEKDIQTRSSALDLSTIKSAAQGKTALQGFLAAATMDTQTAVNKLKSAGSPDVPNGTKIAKAIVNAFSFLSFALNRAAGQATKLPTTSPTAFRSGAQALGTEVRTSMGTIGAGLTGLRDQKLEAAAKKEPACNAITG